MNRFLGAIVGVLLCLGLAVGGPAAAAGPAGGEVLIGQTILSKTMDPHMETGGPSNLTISWLFFEGLLELDSSGALRPCLAKSYEVSKNGLEIVFRLRDDVVFHDGSKFDAAAVKWNLDRVVNPQNKMAARGQVASIKSVEVVNPTTVKLALKEPDAVLIYVLASRFAGMMVSPAAVQKWGKDFGLHPVGTGPFVFEEWISMDRIVAKKNPTYWRKDAQGNRLPYLDKVTIRVVPDTNVKLAELKRGTLHVIDAISAKDIAETRTNPDVDIVQPGTTYFRHLTFNVTQPPLNDKRVRQAICYAINAETILKATGFGEGYLTGFMANKRWPGYDPNWKPYSYNPEKAKELLAQAGYAGKPLRLRYSYYNNDPEKAIGELIQAQLAKVGIQLTLEFVEVSAWIQMMLAGKGEIGIARHETPMPHNWLPLSDRLYPWEGGGRNWSLYKNDEVTKLLDELKKTIDPEMQGALIKKIERIAADDAAYYTVYQATISRGARKELKDYVVSYQGGFKFHQARLAK
jgi:peptide/nickel transport system substrate-binding protein